MAGKQTRAPEFPSYVEWFNVDEPVRLRTQRGRVILLDFGGYSSIRCLRVIEDLHSLKNKYRDDLVIIGIHTPEFPNEKTKGYVRKAINRNHICHPVIHDPHLLLSQKYGIRSWPTLVVIDTNGYIIGAISGNDMRHKLDKLITHLLNRAGDSIPERAVTFSLRQSPEPSRPLLFPGKIRVIGNQVFIADSGHNRVLETTPQGHVLHQYGNNSAGFIDGNGLMAAFDNPQGMVLADDYLYVADTGNHAIRRIYLQGDDVVTIAGTGRPGARPEGDYFNNPLEVDLNSPGGLAITANVIYIAMTGLNQIWALSLVTNTLEIFAGSGTKGLVDGASRTASFAQPSALALMGNTLYVVDSAASAIRAVDLNSRYVTTLAGRGLGDYGDKDGYGCEAKFQYPLDINADKSHRSLWIADTYNNKIKKIDVSSNLVSNVVVRHPLDEPGGLAFSGDTLYIANTNLHEIVRINLRSGNSEALNVNDTDIGI